MQPNTTEQPGILRLSLPEAIAQLSKDNEKSFCTRVLEAKEQYDTAMHMAGHGMVTIQSQSQSHINPHEVI